MITGGCPTETQFDVTRKKQSRSSTFRSSQLARPKQFNATRKKYSRSLFRVAHPWNCRVSHLKQFDVNAKELIFNQLNVCSLQVAHFVQFVRYVAQLELSCNSALPVIIC